MDSTKEEPRRDNERAKDKSKNGSGACEPFGFSLRESINQEENVLSPILCESTVIQWIATYTEQTQPLPFTFRTSNRQNKKMGIHSIPAYSHDLPYRKPGLFD